MITTTPTMPTPTSTPTTTSPTPSRTGGARYQEPGVITRWVVNPLVGLFVRAGVNLRGARLLEVRGRRTGELRRTVVNVLTFEGERYLVAPRGTTQWVRNLRAAGAATLRLGRRHEHVGAAEVADADKAPIIRAYLGEWGSQVGSFFPGLSATSTDAEIRAVADRYPVFRLRPAAG